MKIGIISDVHQFPERVRDGIAHLQSLGIERLVLNGDVGEAAEDLEASQRHTSLILDAVAHNGIETYIQPGSHETLFGYGAVASIFSSRHKNIYDAFQRPFVDIAGYRLAFLPGSDTLCGGEYSLQAEISTGRYAVKKQDLIKLEDYAIFERLLLEEKITEILHVTNIRDLVTIVEDPKTTIVFCHVPAYFPFGPEGVDFAYFARDTGGQVQPGIVLENRIRHIIRKQYGKDLSSDELEKIAEAHGFTFHKENVGNKDLRSLFDELQIRYAINGHIHESGGNAHDRKGQSVPQETPVQELFWNSGCFDQGKMGILELSTEGVAYQNVGL